VKVLAFWGKNDQIVVNEGTEAYRRDVSEERLRVEWLDAGHFALETNESEVTGLIGEFWGRLEFELALRLINKKRNGRV
jgi:surfactin synthase thioesterase subunit